MVARGFLLFLTGAVMIVSSNGSLIKSHPHSGTVNVYRNPTLTTDPKFFFSFPNIFGKPSVLSSLLPSSLLGGFLTRKEDCRHHELSVLDHVSKLPSLSLTEPLAPIVLTEEPKLEDHLPTIIPEAPILPLFSPELPILVPVQEPTTLPVTIPEAPVFPPLSLPQLPSKVIVEQDKPSKAPCKQSQVVPVAPIFEEHIPIFVPEAPIQPALIPDAPILSPVHFSELPMLEPIQEPAPFSVIIPEAPEQPILMAETKAPCKHNMIVGRPVPLPVNIPEAHVLPFLSLPELPSKVSVQEKVSSKTPCKHNQVSVSPIIEEHIPIFVPEASIQPAFIPDAPILPPVHFSELPMLEPIQELAPYPVNIANAPELPPFTSAELPMVFPIHDSAPISVVIPEAPELPPLSLPELPTKIIENPLSIAVLPEESQFENHFAAVIPEAPALSMMIAETAKAPCKHNMIVPEAPKVEHIIIKDKLESVINVPSEPLYNVWSGSSPLIVEAPIQIVFDNAPENHKFEMSVVKKCIKSIVKERVIPNMFFHKK